MSKIMQTFAEHVGVETRILMFRLADGTLLQPGDTPQSMNMKDNDKIDVEQFTV